MRRTANIRPTAPPAIRAERDRIRPQVRPETSHRLDQILVILTELKKTTGKVQSNLMSYIDVCKVLVSTEAVQMPLN